MFAALAFAREAKKADACGDAPWRLSRVNVDDCSLPREVMPKTTENYD